MAQTYDLTSSSPVPAAKDIRTGDIINCPYSGSYKTIELPAGIYQLECWGAQGGSFNSTYIGGKGGYSAGILTLTEKTQMFLYAGGKGTNGTTSGTFAGGFNGGGQAYTSSATYDMSAGGGGSDIRVGQDSLNNRIIVAGGGGGAGSYSSSARYSGGAGGGTSGIAGGSYTTTYPAGGVGTATSAGTSYYGSSSANSTTYFTLASFGVGGAAKTSGYCAGGGGGWYGGGGARRAAGSGGSGYVYTSSTASQHPNNNSLGSTYYLTNAFTVAGNTSFTDYSGSTVTGHEGDGAVRIIALSIKRNKILVKTSSNIWSEISKIFMKISYNEWVGIDIGG